MVSDREDGKETAQRKVSQSEGSTTEYKTIISRREDRKETSQGQVSHRQSSTTGHRNINIEQRRKRNKR